MALIEKPPTLTAEQVSAARIRAEVARLIVQTRRSLAVIRAEMARIGKGKAATALGEADEAELAALYAKAKAVVTAAGETVEDLPGTGPEVGPA